MREEPRPPGPPPRGWRDWALVAVLAPAAVLEGALRPDVPWRTASVVLTVALLPTLLWRRTSPLLMAMVAFGACGLAGLLTTGEAPGLNAMAFVLFLAYALVRWGSGREAGAGAAIAYGKVALSVAFDGMGAPGEVIGAIGPMLGAALLDRFVRQRLRVVPTLLRRDDLLAVAGLVEAGRLAPVLDRGYPLVDAAEAVGYVERGHARARSSSPCRERQGAWSRSSASTGWSASGAAVAAGGGGRRTVRTAASTRNPALARTMRAITTHSLEPSGP